MGIMGLKERTGSSRQAIKKYLAANEKKEIKTHYLNAALKKGVTDGKLVMVKGSYKVSADTKKALTKKAAPKKVKTSTTIYVDELEHGFCFSQVDIDGHEELLHVLI